MRYGWQDGSFRQYAEVAKLADAQDLKSCGPHRPCGFDPHPRHLPLLGFGLAVRSARPPDGSNIADCAAAVISHPYGLCWRGITD